MANENRYYKTPFAESGNKTEVPDVSVGGAVGFDTGFGPDYELPQGSVDRKRIERDMYNGVKFGITKNIKQWQEKLYPTWIEDNGDGVAFSYPEGMIVSHNNVNYVSLEGANQEEPGTGSKWEVKVSLINDLSQTLNLSVAEYKAFGELPTGKRIFIEERDDYFNVISGTVTGNDANIIASDNVDQSASLDLTSNLYKPKSWGLDTTGVTASDDKYALIKAAADAAEEPLTCSGDSILLSSDALMPSYGITGNHKILGAELTIAGRRNFKQLGGRGEYDNLLISNSTYNKFSYADVLFDQPTGGIARIQGGTGGTFWNTFDSLYGDISIEVGDGASNTSVNQNLFINTRGGVDISGGSATNAGVQECDQNLFQMIDTTGANITDPSDSSDGWHMLNRSYLNQNNIVSNLYMEGSGKRAIKGNWHTLRTYSDGNGSPYATPETCHHLLQGDANVRNTHDHLSANPKSNLAMGGLWDVLDAGSAGQPVSFSSVNVTSSVVVDSTAPMGFTHKYGGSSEIAFSSLRVNLSRSYSGRYGLTILLQVNAAGVSFQTENDGSAFSQSADVYHDLGDNWRLYRFSSVARSDNLEDQFTIFFNGSTGNPSENYLAGVWATPQKTTFMPGTVPYTDIKAITNTGLINTVPTALPVGGKIQNYNPSLAAPATIEWVKLSNVTAEPITSIA